MLPRHLLRRIRRLHLRARRAVEDMLGGEYRSIFKGAGLAFEEVRAYLPGDDVRSIDWNVTARMGHPFIKRYVEERELTVLLAVDVSGSLDFGTQEQPKRDAVAELAALLAFCAAANNDKVGLVLFSDRVEKYVPPRKGVRHLLRLIREVLHFRPEGRGTDLAAGLDFLNRVRRRRGLVFLFSDFDDTGFERSFRRAARRHDLIAVRVSDPREEELPDVGLMVLEDAETGRQAWIDTSDPEFRAGQEDHRRRRREALNFLTRSARVDLVEVSTDGNHLDALTRFFRLREKRLGKH